MGKTPTATRVKNLLKKHGLSGVNKAKKTPSHKTKSHMVLAKSGDQVRLIRFGEQGAKTNQSEEQARKFRSRHGKNIAKGKMSAAWWANKVKW